MTGSKRFPGAQQSLVRRLNDEMVCHLLMRHGPLTRTDLAKLGGVTVPAVLKMTNRLVDAGLLVEAGTAVSTTRGPRATLFSLAPEFGTVTSINLIGRTMEVEDRLLDGTITRHERLPLDLGADPAPQLVAAAQARAEHHWVVIGLPGTVNPRTGDVAYSSEVRHWPQGTARRVIDQIGAGVTIDNEVNLRAVAEIDDDLTNEWPDFLLVSLGAGIGAAIMVNGQPLRGYHGAAGEIGYLRASIDPPRTLQQTIGAWDLAHAVGAKHDDDFAWVAQLVRENDADAPVWQELARLIAPGITSMVTVVDPPLVVLGGELSHSAGEPLRAAIAREVDALLPWPAPRVALSELGDEAVLEGAFRRGWSELLHRALATTAS